jgi:signal transduction histidine kinase
MKSYVRTISYFLSILTLAVIFFGTEFIIEKFFFSNDEMVDIAAAIAGALSFAPLRLFFDRATDRIFFHGPKDVHAEFITNISHELQTPIAILRGNVEVLQRKSTTEAERASAERTIVNTLDGMSRVIGNVLESAKITFARKLVHAEDVEVSALLKETCEDFLLLAEDKNVRLLAETAEVDRGPFFIRADRGKLKEVLLNLISNAIKHTHPGGFVRLRAERDHNTTRVIVEDSGCGIAPEALQHIFERFYKIRNEDAAFADNDATGSIAPTVAPSTGIGLNICRQIIDAHGGTIRAESERGKGSRFIIELPMRSP